MSIIIVLRLNLYILFQKTLKLCTRFARVTMTAPLCPRVGPLPVTVTRASVTTVTWPVKTEAHA